MAKATRFYQAWIREERHPITWEERDVPACPERATGPRAARNAIERDYPGTTVLQVVERPDILDWNHTQGIVYQEGGPVNPWPGTENPW